VSTNRRTLIALVSFENVPLLQIGPLAQQLLEAGWEWQRSFGDWCAVLEKEVATGETKDDAEHEIETIMGAFYVPVHDTW
jgi:hypothetical protein